MKSLRLNQLTESRGSSFNKQSEENNFRLSNKLPRNIMRKLRERERPLLMNLNKRKLKQTKSSTLAELWA